MRLDGFHSLTPAGEGKHEILDAVSRRPRLFHASPLEAAWYGTGLIAVSGTKHSAILLEWAGIKGEDPAIVGIVPAFRRPSQSPETPRSAYSAGASVRATGNGRLSPAPSMMPSLAALA
jgi:hypothetical protein